MALCNKNVSLEWTLAGYLLYCRPSLTQHCCIAPVASGLENPLDTLPHLALFWLDLWRHDRRSTWVMSRSGQNGPRAKSHTCRANRRTRLYCASNCCSSPPLTRVWRSGQKLMDGHMAYFQWRGVGRMAERRIDLPCDLKTQCCNPGPGSTVPSYMCMCDSTHAKSVCVHVCAEVALLGCRLVFHSAGSARTKAHFFLLHVHTRARSPNVFMRISSFNFGPHPLVCLKSCMYEWQPRTRKTVWGEGEVGGTGNSSDAPGSLGSCVLNPVWLQGGRAAGLAWLGSPQPCSSFCSLAWCGATLQPQTRPVNCQHCKRCNAHRLRLFYLFG